MNIVITGGAGFLGARLARTLLSNGSISLAGAAPEKIARITLVDRVAPTAALQADARVEAVVGDLNELLAASPQAVVPADTNAVFHLAAAVSGECEADFDLGMRSNFAATHHLLETCRALKTKPVFVFASSLAAFGQTDLLPMPPVITDLTLPTPQTSYGVQKVIGEQLVADYARKGFIRGRTTRLMTVSVRAGKPNGAASGFFSGMIREPLAGIRATVPVGPETPVALASPARTIEGIIRAAEASEAQWGPLIALNLPAMCSTVGEMAAALERVGGKEATALLDWKPDPVIGKIVAGWPGNIRSDRAAALGLKPDASFDEVIRDYVRENPEAVKLKTQA
jgi:D-erythronate 2-dehydrogenase